MIQEVNLQHTRGDTFILPITYKADGVVVNLTGMIINFTIRKDINIGSTVTYTCSGNIVNALQGKMEIIISDTDMDTISMGDYFYDVETIDSSGVKLTILKGKLSIKYDTTR